MFGTYISRQPPDSSTRPAPYDPAAVMGAVAGLDDSIARIAVRGAELSHTGPRAGELAERSAEPGAVAVVDEVVEGLNNEHRRPRRRRLAERTASASTTPADRSCGSVASCWARGGTQIDRRVRKLDHVDVLDGERALGRVEERLTVVGCGGQHGERDRRAPGVASAGELVAQHDAGWA